jgi:phosphatidylglycerol:prolipoprotein diacylglycerol transferase
VLQTLFYIPAHVAGYPVFGFGLLLAVWAVASVALMVWLVWRHGWTADTLGYLPILAVIGAMIAGVLPALVKPAGLPVRGYGVMMLLAVLSGTGLAAWRARAIGLSSEVVFSLVFWMMIPGIVGARAFYVIQFWNYEFWPVYTAPNGSLGALLGAIFNVAAGGLVVYGSFFGGVLGMWLFARKYRIPLLAICDLISPSMMLGLAIGRVGCLLNGCCFGFVCAHPWAITFPAGPERDFTPAYEAQVQRGQMYGFRISGSPDAAPVVLAVEAGRPAARAGLKVGDRLGRVNRSTVKNCEAVYESLAGAFVQGLPVEIEVQNRPRAKIVLPAVDPPPRSLPVIPTQPLSTIDALILCLLLLAYSPFRRRDGELFAVMCSIYPLTRFLVESLRTDEAAVFGTGLTISQVVSTLMLMVAAALWFHILRRPRATASFFPEAAAAPATAAKPRRDEQRPRASAAGRKRRS